MYLNINEEDIICGDRFKSIAHEYIDEDKTQISLSSDPGIIFLKTDWIKEFKAHILPKINFQFKLITHNSDVSAPSGNFDLLEDERLIRWYGMNCGISHPKLQPIPIGIANEKWKHGNRKTIVKVNNASVIKDKLCYSNFNISTNPKKRNYTKDIINNKKFINCEKNNLPFEEYLLKLKSHKYTISPAGNSIDCHRIWESIYMGVIPIIESHKSMEEFYELPILVVDSFEEVSEQLLENKYEEIKSKSIEKSLLHHYTENILQK